MQHVAAEFPQFCEAEAEALRDDLGDRVEAEALAEQRAAKSGRLNRGLKVTGRGIPREGNEIKDSEGTVIGVVTSGTFSPMPAVKVIASSPPSTKA